MREVEIPDTGERMIPRFHHEAVIYAEHIVRYLFATRFVGGKRVLDVASGVGYGADLLSSAGATEVVGLDRSPEAVGYGKKHHSRFRPTYVLGDAQSLPFQDAQFDVVVSFETIEHVSDYHRFLAEVKRALRPDGLLIVSTPNKGVYVEGNPFHTKEFTFDEFEEALAGHFRYVKTFSQDDWIASAVFSPEEMEGADKPVAGQLNLFKAVAKSPSETLYMVSLCSEVPLPEARQQVVLTSLYEIRHYLEEIHRRDAEIERLNTDLSEQVAALAERDVLLDKLDASLAEKDAAMTQLRGAFQNLEQQMETIQRTIGYRLLERMRRPVNRLAPPGTRRRALFVVPRRAFDIVLTEGWGPLLRRALPVWRWGPRKIRRARLASQVGSLDEQYQLWLRAHAVTSAQVQRIREEAARLAYRPQISIIMPVYNTDPAWLREAIESVRGQLYDNWELCIADDASTKPAVRALLREYQGDDRIKVTYLGENQGISGASNAALAMARGEFVGFLDHDDEVKPDALYHVVRLLNERPDLDFIYSDEDKRSSDGRLVQPFFKPDWSPDFLLSTNYVPHFAVYRKQIVDEVGGLRSECDFSQDHDLALRVTERTDRIGHVALPLYTWRMVPGSAALEPEAKPKSIEAAKRALVDAMQRRGSEAEIVAGPFRNTYRVRYRIRGQPLVSIIIPTRDRVELLRSCIAKIDKKSTYSNYEILIVDNESRDEKTLDYLKKSRHRCLAYPGRFNFAGMMNFAVREAAGEHVILLNNDTEVITPEWIEAMLEHSQRPEVAAVGARLLYPDGRAQHEGIIIGVGGGSAVNVDHGGYFNLGQMVRNFSAVTGACMMTRRDLFERLGGFDESLRVAFNDVDYCLRARERGYLIVYTPYAALYHRESSTRRGLHPQEDELYYRRRWGEPGKYRDPYYNPNLSVRLPFTIKTDEEPA